MLNLLQRCGKILSKVTYLLLKKSYYHISNRKLTREDTAISAQLAQLSSNACLFRALEWKL